MALGYEPNVEEGQPIVPSGKDCAADEEYYKNIPNQCSEKYDYQGCLE
jgi:hypothetical protein